MRSGEGEGVIDYFFPPKETRTNHAKSVDVGKSRVQKNQRDWPAREMNVGDCAKGKPPFGELYGNYLRR